MSLWTMEQAEQILKMYNSEPFHIQHAWTVSGVMDWYAVQLGYEADREFWAQVGLLHDVDFERWPQEHCVKAREILTQHGADEAFIHAVCSHGWGMTGAPEKPEHEMEKVLFACDELTGLIGAAAKMRPSGSVMDMELSSLKKKYKDKKFAAGCSRDVIAQGAQMLNWPLDKLLSDTILAMRACEEQVRAQMKRK